ncbi:MAG TPA: hypothetical protein VLL72_00880 [Kiloniellales bacterium]|nr:hypothetical protein [Kiloniellales bacterium]
MRSGSYRQRARDCAERLGAVWLLPAFALVLVAGSPDETTVRIGRADCARLVEHHPAPDVAYAPGVDVHGRPVAPAELDDGIAPALSETVRIRIEVELLERFGIPANPTLYDADAVIGEVTVAPDGRAYFNGQPLQDEAAYVLSRRCQRIERRTMPDTG